MATTSPVNRLLALDYLRGFFIVVIIIDHLWRWPSLLSAFTGQGELWVSSAEGFVIISGLLIGYIRGYKERGTPFSVVVRKLLKRAFLLYVWLLIATVAYTAAIWYLPTISAMPWIDIAKGDWVTLLTKTILLVNAQEWVYFLYLYTLFLAVSPLAIWLLRKGKGYVVAVGVVALSILGEWLRIEWFEWLPVFFLPAVAGFYLPTIQQWWRAQSVTIRHMLSGITLIIVGLILFASALCTYVIPDNSIAKTLNDFFSKVEILYTWRIALALLLFVGFVILFQRILPWLKKWMGWLLLPFGTRSLTAYILHGVLICLLAVMFVDSTNIWLNTAYGIAAILGTWALLRTPIVERLIPR